MHSLLAVLGTPLPCTGEVSVLVLSCLQHTDVLHECVYVGACVCAYRDQTSVLGVIPQELPTLELWWWWCCLLACLFKTVSLRAKPCQLG